MILNYGDRATEDIYYGRNTKGARRIPKDTWPSARRKLILIAHAKEVRDLTSPAGNRLEALQGDWAGYYSVRVNDQWRIVFKFAAGNASDVQVIDYH